MTKKPRKIPLSILTLILLLGLIVGSTGSGATLVLCFAVNQIETGFYVWALQTWIGLAIWFIIYWKYKDQLKEWVQ